MHRRFLLAAAIATGPALLNACDDLSHPTAPAPASQAVGGRVERLVTMTDGCDPQSFIAAGVSCIRPGGVSFERFLDLLAKHQTVGGWHFSPGTLNARVGQSLRAVNQGGETHTFTEVENFGGGSVQVLNDLSGNPVPAPECRNLLPDDFIAPGTSRIDEVAEPGTKHYQCCIHPWMRLDLHARP